MTDKKKELLKDIFTLVVFVLLGIAYILYVYFYWDIESESEKGSYYSSPVVQNLASPAAETQSVSRSVTPVSTVIPVPFYAHEEGAVTTPLWGAYYALVYRCTTLIVGNTYTFEFVNRLDSSNFVLMVASASTSNLYSGFSLNPYITFTAQDTSYTLYGYKVGEAAGSTYAVDLDVGFYIGEYSPGFLQGFNLGYSNGYGDGGSLAKYGIWYGSTVDCTFTYEQSLGNNVVLTENNMKPNMLQGGLDFHDIWAKYQEYDGISLSDAIIKVNFSSPIVYDGSTNIIVKLGASLVVGGYFTDAGGKNYLFEFNYNDNTVGGDKLVLSSVPFVSNIVSMTLDHIGSAYDYLQEITLLSTDTGYFGGYAEGYNSGFDNGKTEGRVEGYDNGLSVGKQEGYANGYQEGLALAQKGDFFSLISAVVDAPITAFTSLLDFEILGFNMRSFVLSLLTAALVICSIRLFAGGKP